MKSIIIFASGSGSNAENIIKYFQDSNLAKVVLVCTNNKDAKVLDKASKLKVSALYLNNLSFKSNTILKILKGFNPDLIVLAGFLLKISSKLVKKYPNKIINIHPALLPNYGGKGMYGMNVHKSVIENCEKESGMTIHYVNEEYDEGNVIFQDKISINSSDDANSLAKKVLKLEHKHFPKVIEKLLLN